MHRHGGRPLLREDLAAIYDAFETPRAVRGDIELLDAPGAREYLAEVRDARWTRSTTHGVGDGRPRDGAPPRAAAQRDDAADAAARPACPGTSSRRAARAAAPGSARPGSSSSPSRPATSRSGARPDGFAYDNERPRHARDVAPS